MKGVDIKNLAVHKDNRGWLAEIFKPEYISSFKNGQVNITTAYPGIVKANHYHTKKSEWYCVLKGKMKLVLKDMKTNETEELIISDDNLKLIKIGANIAHGFKNVGNEMLYLLYYIDTPFDPNDTDTYPVEIIK